jgi:DNA-directed RNA polymerase subunit RPC12/RpoP
MSADAASSAVTVVLFFIIMIVSFVIWYLVVKAAARKGTKEALNDYFGTDPKIALMAMQSQQQQKAPTPGDLTSTDAMQPAARDKQDDTQIVCPNCGHIKSLGSACPTCGSWQR